MNRLQTWTTRSPLSGPSCGHGLPTMASPRPRSGGFWPNSSTPASGSSYHHAADQRETVKLFIELAREVGEDPDYPRRASLFSSAANAAAASAATLAEAREAAGWARQSIALSQPGSRDAAYAHFAAGQALLALHGLDDSPGALEEGIAHLRQAVSLPADDDLCSGAAYQLARALLIRDGRIDREVIDTLTEAGGIRGAYRHNMAVMRAAALLEVARSQPVPSVPERAAAVALLREVARAGDAETSLRMTAAQGWGHEALVLEDFADAATAFRSAIEAQPWQMWWARLPDEQREQIESLQGIASIAASCAAQAGMLEHSVESLERGRAIAGARSYRCAMPRARWPGSTHRWESAFEKHCPLRTSSPATPHQSHSTTTQQDLPPLSASCPIWSAPCGPPAPAGQGLERDGHAGTANTRAGKCHATAQRGPDPRGGDWRHRRPFECAHQGVPRAAGSPRWH